MLKNEALVFSRQSVKSDTKVRVITITVFRLKSSFEFILCKNVALFSSVATKPCKAATNTRLATVNIRVGKEGYGLQNCDEVEIIADYGANVTDSEPASADNSGAGA